MANNFNADQRVCACCGNQYRVYARRQTDGRIVWTHQHRCYAAPSAAPTPRQIVARQQFAQLFSCR